MIAFFMKSKPRVVFDTNIFISAVIFGGNPKQCLELARKGKICLYSSKAILAELAAKLSTKFYWDGKAIEELIEGLLVFTTPVVPKQRVRLIKKDLDDNKILECSLEANANFIISGDKKHILSLGKMKNIQIVTSKQFLDFYFKKAFKKVN